MSLCIHPRYCEIHVFLTLVFYIREGNVLNQKLRFFISLYVAKIPGNLVFRIFLCLGNKRSHKQNQPDLTFRICWHIWSKRYKILSVSEKHELGDNETVCSYVTMRKLNWPLVAIIWHIAFWYRYHHLNVRTLGSFFHLACSMERGIFKSYQRQVIFHMYWQIVKAWFF